jgi:2-methylcitrate dehydratase PrpD
MSSRAVADFISEVRFDRLPSEVVVQAKRAIRDLVAVMIASHKDRAVEAAKRIAIARGGRQESTLFGIGIKVPCEAATFVNGAMATTLDMDDGSMGLPGHPRFHRGHPGGMVITSALAMAEREGANGKAFIEAVVAGYEVELATAWSIGESVLAGRTGTYGAATAAARLLGLGREEVLHTLRIAEAHCPSPTYAFIWNQTDMTKEAPAWAAMTGTMSALLAQAGFKGAPTIFDLPKSNKEPVEKLGKEWEILGIYFKPYSVCRVAHAPLDGLSEILKANRLIANQITKITIGCSTQKSLNMWNARPANIWQAQYSIPFAVGALLVDGEVGPKQISENRLGDKMILQNAEKVVLVPDAEVDALLPGHFAGRVTVETADNRKFEAFKTYPKGEPENPMSEEELAEKFRKLVSRIAGAQKAEELVMCLDRIEQLDHISTLVEKLNHFD